MSSFCFAAFFTQRGFHQTEFLLVIYGLAVTGGEIVFVEDIWISSTDRPSDTILSVFLRAFLQ